MNRVALAVLVVAACGLRPRAGGPSNTAGGSGDVTLYRDRALVRQRVEVEIPPASHATVRVRVAAGIDPDDIYVVERDRFTISEIRTAGDPEPQRPPQSEDEVRIEDPCAPSDDTGETLDEEAAPVLAEPTELELVVGAPQAGTYELHVGYLTDRITWDAAYTMTTTSARNSAVLRGAIAVRNATGIDLAGVRLRVIDAELTGATESAAQLLGDSYVGDAPSTTPQAMPRELGRVDLIDGETRVELLPGTKPRRMRSVLVYDPIGTKLDSLGPAPIRDLGMGVTGPISRRVTESFEIARDQRASAGLPAGPVRLLERRDDGTLVVLGETRLFEESTRDADLDTIAIGTADGVTGRRERREITIDDDNKRLIEEFLITIDNARPRPVEILIREHLYRGQNWVIPYPYLPEEAKEGSQQIVIRRVVPAKGQVQVLYVVVYTWT